MNQHENTYRFVLYDVLVSGRKREIMDRAVSCESNDGMEYKVSTLIMFMNDHDRKMS